MLPQVSLLSRRISWVIAAIVTVLLTSCSRSTEELAFDHPWIRPPLPSRSTSAAYVQIKNLSEQKITVTSADSETIGAIEFHRSEFKDGMHRMIEIEKLEIPASGTLNLEPGGLHLMLFRIQDVKEDEHVIQFHAERDRKFQATFELHANDPK